MYRYIMTRHHVDSQLPSPNQWVLAHYTGTNWGPCGASNPGGQNWKVVLFERGLSIAERADLSDSNARKHEIHGCDEDGNNQRPFCWQEFGPGKLFGQEVDYWVELPEVRPEVTS